MHPLRGAGGTKSFRQKKKKTKNGTTIQKEKKPRPDLTCWFVSSILFTTSVDEIIIIITFNFIILQFYFTYKLFDQTERLGLLKNPLKKTTEIVPVHLTF
jgi:hypothetical protein